MFANLALSLPQGWEWIVVLVVALIIFGRRLPEVGRSIGRGIVEFKKGLKGVRDEIDEVDTEVRKSGEESKRLESDKSADSSRSSEKSRHSTGA